jgi:hypothetical protein
LPQSRQVWVSPEGGRERIVGWVIGALVVSAGPLVAWILATLLTALSGAASPFAQHLYALAWGLVAVWGLAATVTLVVRRRWEWVADFVVLAVLAGAVLHAVPPTLTPQQMVNRHRAALSRLAAEFRAGRLHGDDIDLPPELGPMSIDGQAHRRCDGPVCALYLPAWQNWRHEAGAGYAYFPSTPPKDVTIIVAEGGLGSPDKDFGGGWWWVEGS